MMTDHDGALWVETTIRVRYSETDQMGVVHHANYPIWFEAARSAYCRERGVDYTQMERDGLALPVIDLRCRYLSPAYYDEEITVRSRVIEIRRSLMRVAYEVRRDTTLLASGETLQMLMLRATRKPRQFTPDLYARFCGLTLRGEP